MRAKRAGDPTVVPPWPGRDLFPVRDALVVPADEAQTTILGDHQREGVADCLTETVRRSMTRPDAISSNPASCCGIEIVGPCDPGDFRQLPSNLHSEPENFQRISQNAHASTTCEVGHQVSHLEQGLVHLDEVTRTARLICPASQPLKRWRPRPERAPW